jgi:hypothetical protein
MVPLVVQLGAFDNHDFSYPGAPLSGMDSAQVNQRAIRITADQPDSARDRNLSRLQGAVPVPLLMMHTTVDSSAPLSALQVFRRAVLASGGGENLVQRCVQASGHGTFSDQETVQTWDDFFKWIDEGGRPDGDDLLADLSEVGRAFTDPTRE